MGRAAGVKFTPTLAFVMDALPDTARNIEDLLDKARQSDAKVREASAGAMYAGGADPYRKPEDSETLEDAETDDTAE
ncbi:30S ribosome-binding factor RbfA [Streptomyces hirsutus]